MISRAGAADAYWRFVMEYQDLMFSSIVVGSTAINLEGKDVDILVKTKRGGEKRFLADGYEPCGKEMYPSTDFVALRKGDINLILVFSKREWVAWKAATIALREVVDKTNVEVDKTIRVTVYESVRGTLKNELR